MGRKLLMNNDIPKLNYTELKYLQSTSCQYINTGITPNTNTRVHLKYSHHEGIGMLFGSRGSAASIDQFVLYVENNTVNSYRVGTMLKGINIPTLNHQPHDTIINAIFTTTGVLVNGIDSGIAITTEPFESDRDMYLFATNQGGGAEYSSRVFVYECKIYEGDILLCHLIPCLDSNKIPCMYDKIRNIFLYDKKGVEPFLYAYL